MANKSLKTLAARNARTLNTHLLTTAALHSLFLLLRALLFRPSFTRRSLLLYLLLSAPALLIQLWLERIGRPAWSATGELRRAGEDLEAKGVMEFLWDVLYWSYLCLVAAAVVGDWAWWGWVAIPLYLAWLAFTTFTGARQSMAGLAGAGGEGESTPQGQSRRQQKLEKRGGQKVQYR